MTVTAGRRKKERKKFIFISHKKEIKKLISVSTFRLIYALTCAILNTKRMAAKDATLVSEFRKTVKRDPDRVCYYFQDETWTVRGVS